MESLWGSSEKGEWLVFSYIDQPMKKTSTEGAVGVPGHLPLVVAGEPKARNGRATNTSEMEVAPRRLLVP